MIKTPFLFDLIMLLHCCLSFNLLDTGTQYPLKSVNSMKFEKEIHFLVSLKIFLHSFQNREVYKNTVSLLKILPSLLLHYSNQSIIIINQSIVFQASKLLGLFCMAIKDLMTD